MKTKVEILTETHDYYAADTSRRAKYSRGCHYLMDNGNMCAVGRCELNPPKSGVNLNFRVGISNVGEIKSEILDKKLKPEYRGHSFDFWQTLQSFHDNDRNWNKNGITKRGQTRFKNLIKKYQ